MRLRTWVPALVLALSLAGGCGEDEPIPSGGDEDSETTSPGPSDPTGPASSTSTGSETDPGSPPGGKRLELESISAVVPRGWVVDPGLSENQVSARNVELVSSVSLRQVPGPDDDRSLEQLAREAIDSGFWPRAPKILDPTEIDGVEVFHISGRIGEPGFLQSFGASVDGQYVEIQFLLSEILSTQERQQIVDEILPTVQIG